MKKICCAVLVALGLMLPNAAKAVDLTGLYVAPKFVLNVQHAKGSLSALGYGLGSDSTTEASAGGALAIGYDFSKKFNVPVRAELEYGAYGNISKDKDMSELTRAVAVANGVISADSADAISSNLRTKVGVQTLFANVYWDITTWNNFTPYVGAGIGLAFVKTEATYSESATDDTSGQSYSSSESANNTETVFAGQVGFGCSYAFTDNISADFGYRFLMMGDGETEKYGIKVESTDNYAHQFMLGVRVTF